MKQLLSLEVRLKLAKAIDAELVASIIRGSFSEYEDGGHSPMASRTTGKMVRRHLEERRKQYVVAYLGDRSVGVAGFGIRRKRIVFGPVCVAPDYRRNGVGSAMLQWIERRGRSRRCRWAVCIVFRGLDRLIAFYASSGYTFSRTRSGLIMARKRLR